VLRFVSMASCLLCSSPLTAQPGGPSEPASVASGGTQGGGEAPRALTPPYEAKVREGVEAYVREDRAAAREAFRQAIQMDSSRPEAYYYQGVTQRAEGDLPGAAQSFRAALQRAESSDKAMLALQARVGLADVAERSLKPPASPQGAEGVLVDQEGLDRVQSEWSNLQSAFQAREEEQWAMVAQTRGQAAFQVLEQDQVYVEVRRRIAEREKEKAEQASSSSSRGHGGR